MAETKDNDNVVVAENIINANDKENEVQSTDAGAKDIVKEVEQQPQVDAHVTGTPMDTDETAAASMIAQSKDGGVDKMVEIEMKTIAGRDDMAKDGQGHEHGGDVQKDDECKDTTPQTDIAPVVHEQSQSDVVTTVVCDTTAVETTTTTLTTIVEQDAVVTTVVEEKVDEKVIECVTVEQVSNVVDDQHMGDDEPQAKIAKVMSPVLATVAKDADAAGVDKIQMLGNQHIQNTRSYLDQTLVPILLEALAAAARARPADAISFVAEFLMKNKERFDKKIAMEMQQQKGLPQ